MWECIFRGFVLHNIEPCLWATAKNIYCELVYWHKSPGFITLHIGCCFLCDVQSENLATVLTLAPNNRYEEQESAIATVFAVPVSWKQLFLSKFSVSLPLPLPFFSKWPLSLHSAVPLVSYWGCVVSFVAMLQLQACGSFLFFTQTHSLSNEDQ